MKRRLGEKKQRKSERRSFVKWFQASQLQKPDDPTNESNENKPKRREKR
jgi:hypothetical protein